MKQKALNTVIDQEVEKIRNQIRAAERDVGYSKARLKIAEDKIKYYERRLAALVGPAKPWRGPDDE